MGVSLKHQTENFLASLEKSGVTVKRIEKSLCDEPIFKQICNFFYK